MVKELLETANQLSELADQFDNEEICDILRSGSLRITKMAEETTPIIKAASTSDENAA